MWSSRRGTTSRPGASSPQCDSESQTFTVRMPAPEKRAVLMPVGAGIDRHAAKCALLDRERRAFSEIIREHPVEPDVLERFDQLEHCRGVSPQSRLRRRRGPIADRDRRSNRDRA